MSPEFSKLRNPETSKGERFKGSRRGGSFRYAVVLKKMRRSILGGIPELYVLQLAAKEHTESRAILENLKGIRGSWTFEEKPGGGEI